MSKNFQNHSIGFKSGEYGGRKRSSSFSLLDNIITKEKKESKENSIVKKQDKTMKKKKIFDEIKDFIDEDNKEFQEFM